MTKSEWLPIALEMNFMINASEYGRDYRKIRPSLERVWTDIGEGAKEELKRIKSSFKPQPWSILTESVSPLIHVELPLNMKQLFFMNLLSKQTDFTEG